MTAMVLGSCELPMLAAYCGWRNMKMGFLINNSLAIPNLINV